ncbi:MAG: hypothetical protein QG564_736, partial [Campylobacterota bacterium]|nr:hypothetical protein [Campylobacterota bacterium]
TKLYQPKTITSKEIQDNGTYKVYGANGVIGYFEEYNHEENEVVITCRGATCGTINMTEAKSWITGNAMVSHPIDNTKLLKIYLFEMLKYIDLSIVITGTAQPQITRENISPIKIPLPPLEIQEEIVKECQKVDDEVLKANETIEQSKANIILAMNSSEANTPMKLGDACDMKAGKFVSAKDIFDENDGSMYPCFGGNGQRGFTKTFTHDGVYPLIGRQGALCGNITLAQGKFHATEHAVAVTPLVEMDIKWLYHKLILLNLNQYATGTAQPGLSVNNIKTVSISMPPLETQKQIVSKIEKLETLIAEAKKVIEGSKEQKETILREYL